MACWLICFMLRVSEDRFDFIIILSFFFLFSFCFLSSFIDFYSCRCFCGLLGIDGMIYIYKISTFFSHLFV